MSIKEGQSNSFDIFLRESELKLLLKEIDENNLFIAASLAHLFGAFVVVLSNGIELTLGIIWLLVAVMIIWFFRDRGREIRRKCEKHVEQLRHNALGLS